MASGVGWCLIEVRGKPCGALVHQQTHYGRRTGMDRFAEPDTVEIICDEHGELGRSEWTEVYLDPDEEDDT